VGDQKPSDFGGGGAFEVSGEAAASAEPSKGAFDDPAPRQKLKAFDPERSLDDFDGPRPATGKGVNKLFAAINPVGKDMPKLGKAVSQALQQRDRTMDILNVGGMNLNGKQQAVGVGDDVPLAPMDAFPGVEAARTAGLRCRSALAVDDGSRRARLASEFPPRLPNRSSDDLVPPTGVAPGIEIAPGPSSTAGTRAATLSTGSRRTE
jgi:hypothetical protein